MRRFSQRNSLVTLSDINITPLLDLAFVLLIIFIITTPLLEQSLSLKPHPAAPQLASRSSLGQAKYPLSKFHLDAAGYAFGSSDGSDGRTTNVVAFKCFGDEPARLEVFDKLSQMNCCS